MQTTHRTLLFLSLIFAFAIPDIAGTYYVSPFGSDSNSGSESSPFQTLYKALYSGTSVIVMPGVYTGPLNTGLYLSGLSSYYTVTAQPGTVFSCINGANFLFNTQNNPLTVSGFLVRDCAYFLLGSSSYSASTVFNNTFTNMTNILSLSSSASTSFYNNVVSNTATIISRSSGTIKINSFSQNYFSSISSLALDFSSVSGPVTISNCTFSNVSSTVVKSNQNLFIQSSNFINSPKLTVPLILATAGSISINLKNSNFNGILGQQVDGVIVAVTDPSVSLTINGTLFTKNAGRNGGAIYSAGSVNINESTFNSNSASSAGGAIYCNGTRMYISNTYFGYNYAPVGSAYYCNNCLSYNSTNVFVGNTGVCN